MEREEDRLTCDRCPFDRRCTDSLPGRAAFPDIDPGTTWECHTCPRHHVMTHPLPLDDPFAWACRLENGIMPLSGGWLDQPNVYTETMAIVEVLIAESKRRWRLKQEEKAKHIMDAPKV